jgi:hypothetical protein
MPGIKRKTWIEILAICGRLLSGEEKFLRNSQMMFTNLSKLEGHHKKVTVQKVGTRMAST